MKSAALAHVRSHDPVLEAGVKAQLRGRRQVRLVDDAAVANVAIVVSDSIDSHACELVATLRRVCPNVVCVISLLDDSGLIEGVGVGAIGFVRRADAGPDRLISVILAAADGEASVPPNVMGGLLSHLGRLQSDGASPMGLPLSEREADVLRLAADGLETAEIARRLAYSERTVKGVIHGVTTRYQLRNRTHAVAYAMRNGLI